MRQPDLFDFYRAYPHEGRKVKVTSWDISVGGQLDYLNPVVIAIRRVVFEETGATIPGPILTSRDCIVLGNVRYEMPEEVYSWYEIHVLSKDRFSAPEIEFILKGIPVQSY